MPSTYTPSNTYHTTIQIPSDGDARSASSVNTPLEGIADNAAYLKARVGGKRLITLSQTGTSEASNSEANTPIATTFSATHALLSTLVTGVAAVTGDIYEYTISGTADMLSNAAAPMAGWLRAFVQENGGGYVAESAAYVSIVCEVNGQNSTGPFSITGYHTVAASGNVDLALYGRVTTTSGINNGLILMGGLNCVTRLWRGN